MSPYAEIIIEYQENIKLRNFPDIDSEDSHNIQLHFKYLDFLVSFSIESFIFSTGNLCIFLFNSRKKQNYAKHLPRRLI